MFKVGRALILIISWLHFCIPLVLNLSNLIRFQIANRINGVIFTLLNKNFENKNRIPLQNVGMYLLSKCIFQFIPKLRYY